MLEPSPWYDGREQSYVKHYVLEQYLARFARIIGSRWSSITYVDSFAGPWRNRHPDLLDTSFAIAVEKLREARDWVSQTSNRQLRIRCLFLENTKSAFKKLQRYAESLPDIDAKPLNEEFETAVPKILTFIAEPKETFTFLFIDPTGWTGFSIDVIRPLLERSPNEVLINFMTSDIRRFLEDEKSSASFARLFGHDISSKFAGLEGDAREEKAVHEYMRSVKRAGKFLYVGSAIVFKPEIETPYFHLIYATRHNRGIEKFKEVEEHMVAVATDVRAEVKARKTPQMSFLAAREMHTSTAMQSRRERYVAMARARVLEKLQRERRVAYDVIWRMALAFPLVWPSDVRDWIDEWKTAGKLVIPTLAGRRHVLDPERDRIEWIGR